MTTKHLVHTALVTAIICILGIIPGVPLPFTSVPIVSQSIGIFLAGIILGRKFGATSVIVFLLLVTTGLPVLSGGRGGIGALVRSSVGFLFPYPVIVYFMGIARDVYLHKISFLMIFIATLVIGVLGLDILDTITMGFIIHIPISKIFILSFAFIPGGIIKAIIASLIGIAILNHSCFRTLIR